VTGKVQGVFFRASTKETAVSLGLHGYAKNLPDGQVEVMLQGETKHVQTLVDWLQTGPKLARVDSVIEVDALKLNNLMDFNIL
jgi:acylphosphatase